MQPGVIGSDVAATYCTAIYQGLAQSAAP
jgi:hypothetical protein